MKGEYRGPMCLRRRRLLGEADALELLPALLAPQVVHEALEAPADRHLPVAQVLEQAVEEQRGEIPGRERGQERPATDLAGCRRFRPEGEENGKHGDQRPVAE